MQKSYINILTIIFTLLFAQNAFAGKLIKCWKNKNGIRECSSRVPPEYSRHRIEIVNERGMVIEVIPAAKTEEELAEERRQEMERKEKEAELAEQARLDQILLNTYTTERDLLLARDNNLQTIQSQIDVTKKNMQIMVNELQKLEKKAGNYERNGTKPPPQLTASIAKTEREIAKMQQYVEKRQADYDAMALRFEEDLARFRVLKSGGI